VTLSNPGVAGGAGAMISSVGDLMTWARELAGATIIGPTLQALRLHTRPLSTGPINLSYGMGIMDLNGFLGHNGGILGYSTAMFYLPKRHATIVVEANSDNVSSTVATSIFVALASYLFPHQFPHGS
jgi:D-alanyl-D-alanine carboxypeptidase